MSRTLGNAENVLWTRLDDGVAVAVVVFTSRLGPAVAGCVHIPTGDSADVVAQALRRAEQVTMAAVTSRAAVSGACVAVFGTLTDETPAALGRLFDEMKGAMWLVPGLGNGDSFCRTVAPHTRFVADPGPAVAAVGIVDAAEDAWRETVGSDMAGVTVTVLGVGPVADAVEQESTRRGALAERRLWQLPMPATEILIATDAVGRTGADTARVDCRVMVGSMGGPLDDQDVWNAVTSRGITCVPGSIATGKLLRAAGEIVAAHSPSQDEAGR